MKRNDQHEWKLLARLAFTCALIGICATMAAQEAKVSGTPYASIGAVAYRGPGRSPEFDLQGKVIRIGILAPLHGTEKADGDAIVLAAQMALQDASRIPFPHGQRLGLAIADESGPSWGLTADALLHLVHQDSALAIVTSAHGSTAHLSEQVGNRIGIPILTLSTDPTTTEIDLPWIFRLGPSDSRLMNSIVQEVRRNHGAGRILLIAESNHDGRIGASELGQAAAAADGLQVAFVYLNPQRPDFSLVQAELNKQPVGTVVVWTRSEIAAQLVGYLDQSGVRAAIYLSPQAAQAGFDLSLGPATGFRATGSPKERVWVSDWHSGETASRKSFEESFEQQTGSDARPVAAEAYDAVTLLAEAFRQTGPNRARVRDYIAGVRHFTGVSGNISFDERGNDSPPVHWMRLARHERKP